jgi:hypothetical protein
MVQMRLCNFDVTNLLQSTKTTGERALVHTGVVFQIQKVGPVDGERNCVSLNEQRLSQSCRRRPKSLAEDVQALVGRFRNRLTATTASEPAGSPKARYIDDVESNALIN